MDEIKPGQSLSDEQAMSLAIAEARKGSGFVSPNPQVGCVILDSQNRLLSTGYHKIFGGPHAEVNALSGLTDAVLKQARVFVTLEPCAHEGKTPSCAKALSRLSLKQVVYGLVDPNPLVSGQGAQIIAAAGIPTTVYRGALKQELEELCEHFLINQRQHRPFISLKVASSLDGQMGLANGDSKWITGDTARQYGHYLRATHDAILIGQGTLEKDNPSLDIRHPDFPNKKNKVIVLMSSKYSHLNVMNLNILKVHSPADVYFLERRNDGYRSLKIEENGSLSPSSGESEYDLNLTRRFKKSGLAPFGGSILIEGGARVVSSFINEGRAHRLYLFQAPILLGAKGGKAWSEDVIISSMDKRISLKNPRVQSLGADQLITGRF